MPHRIWDGDYVVYNPVSGNTHILDIVSGELLAALFDGERDASQLHTHIARFLDVPDDALVATRVDRVLEVLDDLGLVERAAC
ncbi:MAG TPA: HPr-rel-A system PqqD family peptide chaperone [Casimicrobiaceae bacterium]|nr:HPr-rel-A system PqqD family peptide chaperone [Casimicrobiaceae bacterium]